MATESEHPGSGHWNAYLTGSDYEDANFAGGDHINLTGSEHQYAYLTGNECRDANLTNRYSFVDVRIDKFCVSVTMNRN